MSQQEDATAFDHLNGILNLLLSPEGCPWDREQTMLTLRKTLLEETCELIEAIDLNDNAHITEELGDLFLNALFLCKMAQKEKRCTTPEVLDHLSEKLIRRHPHIFGDAKVTDADHVKRQWDEIKRSENGKESRKSLLDGIPLGLPALARAHKMAARMKKAGFTPPDCSQEEGERHFGFTLWTFLQSMPYEPEQALRSYLSFSSEKFRSWEEEQRQNQTALQ